jgi:hypothetical protein
VTDKAKFWSLVQTGSPNDCWHWMGPKSPAGYGSFRWEGRRRQATHLALILSGHAQPGKLMALHSCDNPVCVNPAHLRWGDHVENAADMTQRGRSAAGCKHGLAKHPERRATGERHRSITKPETVKKGEDCNLAKLSVAEVVSIRADQRRLRVIANEHNVSEATVSMIRRRITWRHIE